MRLRQLLADTGLRVPLGPDVETHVITDIFAVPRLDRASHISWVSRADRVARVGLLDHIARIDHAAHLKLVFHTADGPSEASGFSMVPSWTTFKKLGKIGRPMVPAWSWAI